MTFIENNPFFQLWKSFMKFSFHKIQKFENHKLTLFLFSCKLGNITWNVNVSKSKFVIKSQFSQNCKVFNWINLKISAFITMKLQHCGFFFCKIVTFWYSIWLYLEGQFDTFLSFSDADLLSCLGSLSCCVTQFWLNFSFLTNYLTSIFRFHSVPRWQVLWLQACAMFTDQHHSEVYNFCYTCRISDRIWGPRGQRLLRWIRICAWPKPAVTTWLPNFRSTVLILKGRKLTSRNSTNASTTSTSRSTAGEMVWTGRRNDLRSVHLRPQCTSACKVFTLIYFSVWHVRCRSQSLQRAKMGYNNYRNNYDNLNSWLSRVPNYEPRETDDVRQVETKLKNQRVRRAAATYALHAPVS